MHISIISLEGFYQLVRSSEVDQIHSVAIISSSYPIDTDLLNGVKHIFVNMTM